VLATRASGSPSTNASRTSKARPANLAIDDTPDSTAPSWTPRTFTIVVNTIESAAT
jgi:hypothetical protein